jgi:hypothetical protein
MGISATAGLISFDRSIAFIDFWKNIASFILKALMYKRCHMADPPTMRPDPSKNIGMVRAARALS